VFAYRNLHRAMGGDWESACRDALAWLERDVLPRWPHLRRELRATPDVPVEEAAFVWCRSELMGAVGLYGGECTAAARGDLAGQTWDWHPSFAGTLSVRQVPSAQGPMLVVAEVGQPAKLGLSAARVWIGLNWLAGTRAVEPGDVPVHVAVRVVLEDATSAADAAARLAALPLAQAAAFPVHGPDGSFVVERHPGTDAAVVEAGRGWLVHANHPDDERVAVAQGHDPWRVESQERAARLATALDGDDAATLARGLTAVGYAADPADPDPERIATLAAVIAAPGDGWLALCPSRPAPDAPTTIHHLDGRSRATVWGALTP
jgi:hypothetical protein